MAVENWIESRVASMARQADRTHAHPTVTGFGMRVSPKKKAVWTWRLDDLQGVEKSGTLGSVAGSFKSPSEALTVDEALAKFDEVRKQLLQLKPVELPPGMTFKQAFDRWLVEHRKERGGSELVGETKDYYKVCVDRYLQEAHDWVLTEVKTAQWFELLTKVRGRSVTRARALMYMLSSLYAHFIDLDQAEVNPIARKTMKSNFAGADTKVVLKSYVKVMDIPLFYAAVQGLRRPSRDAIMTLFLTGWRCSGVLRMRWEDVNLKEGKYTVKPGYGGWKGLVGDVALGAYVVAHLQDRKEMLQAKGQLGEYVFPARYGKRATKVPKHPHMDSVRGSLDDSVQPMIGYKVMPHDLRRTFVTLAEVVLGNGALRIIGKLVGHRQLGFEKGQASTGTLQTARYVAEALEREQKAATEVEEALLEICGFLPMSDETEKLLREVAIDPTNLHLIEMPDDDEEQELAEAEA